MRRLVSILAAIGSCQLMDIPFTHADAQEQSSGFEGMWSDPPATAVDWFCSGRCTEAGVERLEALLDDPANDERPFSELDAEAHRYQEQNYYRPRLLPSAAADFPLDPAADPGFLRCEPWGFARQILSRHQLEIRHFDDRLETRYGEWDAHRTVYLDGRSRPVDAPPTRMGFSVGHFDGDELVIETSGISANQAPWSAFHSDQLRVTERYTLSEDGQRLFLTATFEDPGSLREPIVMKKIWGWAPTEEIYPYVDCERPRELSGEEDW